MDISFSQLFSFIRNDSVNLYTYIFEYLCEYFIRVYCKSEIAESKGIYIKIFMYIAKLSFKMCTILHSP